MSSSVHLAASVQQLGMSTEELQNPNKAIELFENGTGVNRSSKDLEPNDKSLKEHDEAGSSAAVARSSVTEVDEAAKNKSNLLRQARNCCAYLKQTAVLIWVERVFLILICIAVVVGFTVPIIIYAVDTDRGSDNSTLSIDLDVDNCPSFDMQVC